MEKQLLKLNRLITRSGRKAKRRVLKMNRVLFKLCKKEIRYWKKFAWRDFVFEKFTLHWQRYAAAALVIGLLLNGGLAGVSKAYFNDEEKTDNAINAGSVNLSLHSTGDFSPDTIILGEHATRTINIANDGLLGFKYKVVAQDFSQDTDLCQILDLIVDWHTVNVFDGKLKDFALATPLAFDPLKTDLNYKITLPSAAPDSLQNKTCSFKFVYSGWQDNMAGPMTGFFDSEEITNTIKSGSFGGIVINKVYAYPDTLHGGADYELVELYNNTNDPISLCGWKIGDNVSDDLLYGTIAAHGYALIYQYNPDDNWLIPDGVLRIKLLNKIGNGLDNTADVLVLKDKTGHIVDQMNWGTPQLTWRYYSTSWNPGTTAAGIGKMLARVPSGHDTDQASDFTVLTLPNATVIWPNGGEVLYVGRDYTLTWTAHNNNGPDSDLKIQIWYSNDSGNTWGKVAEDLPNTGSYTWVHVPVYLPGHYFVASSRGRIAVIATGPENFLVQGYDISDHDFCPPFDWSLLTPEEIAQLAELGIYPPDGITIEQPKEIIDSVEPPADEPIIEPMPDDQTEAVIEETPPTDEPIAPDDQIATEETPVPTDPAEQPAEPATTEALAPVEEQSPDPSATETPVIEAPPVEAPVIQEAAPVVTEAPAAEPAVDQGGGNE